LTRKRTKKGGKEEGGKLLCGPAETSDQMRAQQKEQRKKGGKKPKTKTVKNRQLSSQGQRPILSKKIKRPLLRSSLAERPNTHPAKMQHYCGMDTHIRM